MKQPEGILYLPCGNEIFRRTGKENAVETPSGISSQRVGQEGVSVVLLEDELSVRRYLTTLLTGAAMAWLLSRT